MYILFWRAFMVTESEKRLHRCCFTGHRPEKLNKSETEVKAVLKKAVSYALAGGHNVFISGMARGVDIWAAEIVLEAKKINESVKLICASPYEGFEKNWSDEWQSKYHTVMQSADLVKFISPSYSYMCLQKRNQWMVDHSSLVIAVYNGGSGGTRNTIEYAKKKQIITLLT